HVVREDRRCRVRVRDTGVGLRQGSTGLGTGLSTLRERLRLSFGDDATLRLSAGEGGGAVAELDLPALTEPVSPPVPPPSDAED
ncbi:MAG TPA: hypothetical protein VD948_01390, partial [Rhodothermales bacterium]|nr:hypothetical protein [Rhodothermales bacterium]